MPSPRAAARLVRACAIRAFLILVSHIVVSACSRQNEWSPSLDSQKPVFAESSFVFNDRLLFGSAGSLARLIPSAGADTTALRAARVSAPEGADHLIWQAWGSSVDSQGAPLGPTLHSWDLTPAARAASNGQRGLAVPGARPFRGAARRVLALPDFLSIHLGWECPVHSVIERLAQIWGTYGSSHYSGSTRLLMPPEEALRSMGCVWVPALNCLAAGSAAFSVPGGGGAGAGDPFGGLIGRSKLADACGRASWFLQSGRIGRTFDRQPEGFVFSPERVFSILIYDQPAASLSEALLGGAPVASFPPQHSCADPLGRCLVSPLFESSCRGCSELVLGQHYWVFLLEAPGQLNESTLPVEIVVGR